MKIDNFILTVSGKDDREGYVNMSHGEVYTVDLHNCGDRRCTAEISVDGKNVGVFRLNTHSSLKLEHPSGDCGKFTFYRLNSKEFHSVGLDKVNKDNLGLVSVVFKPEKYRPVQEYLPTYPVPIKPWPRPNISPYWCGENNYGSTMDSPIGSSELMSFHTNNTNVETKCYSVGPKGQDISSGGTGLSGHSGQKFHTVEPLDYAPSSEWVEINLRLVYNENEGKPRELKENYRRNKPPLPI